MNHANFLADYITEQHILINNLKAVNSDRRASLAEMASGDYVVDWNGIEADLFIARPQEVQTPGFIIDRAYDILAARLAALLD